jgi:hypothetical protein
MLITFAFVMSQADTSTIYRDLSANKGRWVALLNSSLLHPHAGVPRPDDGSGPVDQVQLGDDIGDVVTFAAHAEATGDRSVVTTCGQ